MDYKIFIPVLIAFVLSVVMGPLIIPVLRRLKMGQTEREDGVKSHLKKTGTPTMGDRTGRLFAPAKGPQMCRYLLRKDLAGLCPVISILCVRFLFSAGGEHGAVPETHQ